MLARPLQSRFQPWDPATIPTGEYDSPFVRPVRIALTPACALRFASKAHPIVSSSATAQLGGALRSLPGA